MLKAKRPVYLFGVHAGVPETVLPRTDAWYRMMHEVLDRCRAFPHDIEVFRRCEFETDYLDHLTEPDKDSLDIGANLGFYSAFLSPRSRFVYGFEPNRRVMPFLQTALSAYPNCLVIPLAAGKSAGMAEFYVPDMDPDPVQYSGSAGLMKRLMDTLGIPTKPMPVPVVTIDSFGFDKIACMKIDVEGSEIDVLAGAEQTIARNRPSIIFENEYRHNPECENVFAFLIARDYQGYFIDRQSRKPRPFEEFSMQRDQKDLLDEKTNVIRQQDYIFSFIFVPKEKDRLRPLLDGQPGS